MRSRRTRALLTAGAVALVLGAPAGSALLADDVVLQAGVIANQTVTPGRVQTGRNFRIGVDVTSTAAARQYVTMQVALPSGLSWGADFPHAGEGCQEGNPAVCRVELQPRPAGTVGTGWAWDVVAAAPGEYTIAVLVDPTDVDPNLTNNQASFTALVGPAVPTPKTIVRATRFVPAKPKAGRSVTVRVPVTKGSAGAVVAGVRCTAAIRGVALRGTAGSARGLARCTFRPPVSAKGRTLAGSVSFVTAGRRVTRKFAVALR